MLDGERRGTLARAFVVLCFVWFCFVSACCLFGVVIVVFCVVVACFCFRGNGNSIISNEYTKQKNKLVKVSNIKYLCLRACFLSVTHATRNGYLSADWYGTYKLMECRFHRYHDLYKTRKQSTQKRWLGYPKFVVLRGLSVQAYKLP